MCLSYGHSSVGSFVSLSGTTMAVGTPCILSTLEPPLLRVGLVPVCGCLASTIFPPRPFSAPCVCICIRGRTLRLSGSICQRNLGRSGFLCTGSIACMSFVVCTVPSIPPCRCCTPVPLVLLVLGLLLRRSLRGLFLLAGLSPPLVPLGVFLSRVLWG